jgi:DNA invertase Pin-like site-specific DNA recombinase
VLSTLAEIDYKTRREAQREGIDRAKAEGKYKGRANGTTLTGRQLGEKHSDIVRELNKGDSIRRTARLTGKSKSTVQRVKKAMDHLEVS